VNLSEHALQGASEALPGTPRVVASGNFASPTALLGHVDKVLERYRLNVLNAQPGIPTRNGVIHETSFVGPGMRASDTLRYVPTRLSLLPSLFHSSLPPDAVLLHTSLPHNGTVSLGTEVNVLPAAIEAVRRRGGLVLAQMNAQMPYTFGDAVVPLDLVDHAIEVDTPLASPQQQGIDEAAQVIVGDEVDELVVVVEDQFGGHRVCAVAEGAADAVRAAGLPGDRGADQGCGGEEAEVVEQGDGLGPVHLRPGDVHHRQQRTCLDALVAVGPR